MLRVLADLQLASQFPHSQSGLCGACNKRGATCPMPLSGIPVTFGTQVRQSRLLQKILSLILAVGNNLNANSFAGGAEGFRVLETLPRLSEVRSADGRKNLIHFLVAIGTECCGEEFWRLINGMYLSHTVSLPRGPHPMLVVLCLRKLNALRVQFQSFLMSKERAVWTVTCLKETSGS